MACSAEVTEVVNSRVVIGTKVGPRHSYGPVATFVMMKPTDVPFMRRALDLAHLGTGYARPNPLVGCVVMHQDRIIGEGWHRQYGGPHAEVNALTAVADQSLLKESRVYVTLEPCAHHGKTPPCADLLIAKGVPEVVICNPDPFPLVAGRGIEKLRAAGIKVDTGLLAVEGRRLNRRFFTFHEKKRPYLALRLIIRQFPLYIYIPQLFHYRYPLIFLLLIQAVKQIRYFLIYV